MTFKPFSSAQQDKVRSAVAQSAQIHNYALLLAKDLQEIYSRPTSLKDWGMVFQLEDGKSDVYMQTPFGAARAKLVIMVDERGVFGRYVIEKRFEKRNDEQAWMPVWAIRIEEDGSVYAGDEVGNPINSQDEFPNKMQIVKLALSILYAIGNTSI